MLRIWIKGSLWNTETPGPEGPVARRSAAADIWYSVSSIETVSTVRSIVTVNIVSSIVTVHMESNTKVKSTLSTVSGTKMKSTVSIARRMEYYFDEATRV